MDIRRSGLGDDDVVAMLRIEFVAGFRGVDVDDLPEDFRRETARFVADGHARGTMLSWLAEEDGAPCGLVSVLLQDAPPRVEDARSREGLVVNMYVRPAWRRTGLGRRLLGSCVEGAPAAGIRRLNLYATPDGRPLYRATGFVPRSDWMILELPLPS